MQLKGFVSVLVFFSVLFVDLKTPYHTRFNGSTRSFLVNKQSFPGVQTKNNLAVKMWMAVFVYWWDNEKDRRLSWTLKHSTAVKNTMRQFFHQSFYSSLQQLQDKQQKYTTRVNKITYQECVLAYIWLTSAAPCWKTLHCNVKVELFD